MILQQYIILSPAFNLISSLFPHKKKKDAFFRGQPGGVATAVSGRETARAEISAQIVYTFEQKRDRKTPI